MKKSIFSILIVLSALQTLFSQAPVRRLPTIINHPSLNLHAPFISADGNALLFVSDNGADGAYTVFYTSRDADWSAPVELPKPLNNRLNFMRGYALSADGKQIFVASAKTPVIGGYDIFTSVLKGSTWSTPENLTVPINSKLNDACPSLTPDGKTIYFMRCDQMDMMKASGCKIFKSTLKPNGQWEEPVILPDYINSGNSQTPRIMADGETLIFSSDKIPGGKGGMDLYISRLSGGSWSHPEPLDFANTEKDDQYVSVSALGRYLLKEAKGSKGNFELTEFLLPSNVRPKGLMKVEGMVASNVPSYISVTDLQTNKRILATQPAPDGSFFLYLPEGSYYELAIDPDPGHYTYYSRLFDLRSEKIAQKEKMAATIKEPAAGDELPLDLVVFDSSSQLLTKYAEAELRRFSRMVKANPELKFEVNISMDGYKEDSVRSSPDLTQMKVDTLAVVAADTAQVALEQEYNARQTKTTYHNDITMKMAEAISQFLSKEGLAEDQLHFVVNATPGEDPPQYYVKAIVR